MKTLLINGPVVDDSDTWFYDFWGDPYVSPKSVRDFLAEANGEAIQVSINSGGGSVFAGSEIYTLLKSYAGRVDVVVAGLAGSIASIIMLAGDTIKASPIAQIMIHNASMGAYGDYRDLENASVIVGGVSQSLVSLYTHKTGLGQEDIKELVDAETWFTAERAKEIGLIDEVLFMENVTLVASVGNYVSKDKIYQFKQMMDRQEKDSPLSAIVERLDKLENKIDAIEHHPVAELKMDIDVQELAEKLAALSQEDNRKAKSPFGKFL